MAQLIPFKDVAKALRYHYPHPKINKDTINRYKEIMEEISKYKENPEKDKEWTFFISMSRPYRYYNKNQKQWIVMDEPGEEYYSAHGKKKGDRNTWAIEFSRWEETSNWKINKGTLKHYRPAEILAHYLWEMTYCGFKQAKIKKISNDLHDRIDKIKKDSKKYSKPYEGIK